MRRLKGSAAYETHPMPNRLTPLVRRNTLHRSVRFAKELSRTGTKKAPETYPSQC
jgi:hypothetical protein